MNRYTAIHNNIRESIVTSSNRLSFSLRDILNMIRDSNECIMNHNVTGKGRIDHRLEYDKSIPDSELDSDLNSHGAGAAVGLEDSGSASERLGAHPAAAPGLRPSAPWPGPGLDGDCESGDPNFRNELQAPAFISTADMSKLSGVPVDFLRRAADRIGGRRTKTSGPRAGGGPGWRWEFDPGQADRVRLMWIRARKDVLNRVGVTREGVDYRHDGSVSRRDEKHTRKRLASLSRGEARRKMERDSDQAALAGSDSGAAGPGA